MSEGHVIRTTDIATAYSARNDQRWRNPSGKATDLWERIGKELSSKPEIRCTSLFVHSHLVAKHMVVERAPRLLIVGSAFVGGFAEAEADCARPSERTRAL